MRWLLLPELADNLPAFAVYTKGSLLFVGIHAAFSMPCLAVHHHVHHIHST